MVTVFTLERHTDKIHKNTHSPVYTRVWDPAALLQTGNPGTEGESRGLLFVCVTESCLYSD